MLTADGYLISNHLGCGGGGGVVLRKNVLGEHVYRPGHLRLPRCSLK